MNRRIEDFHAEIHCIYASHASLQNLTGHLQVNKSNENYYLSDDTVIESGGHQANHMTGVLAQAKLCCYDGWLRPQICTEKKVTI
jgi:hypothetical protein